MSQLVCEFTLVGPNVLCLRVLEQPEDIRRGCGVLFTASNGCRIESFEHPGMGPAILFLRGKSAALDAHADARQYVTDVARNDALVMYVAAIEEYNASRAKAAGTPAAGEPRVVIAK